MDGFDELIRNLPIKQGCLHSCEVLVKEGSRAVPYDFQEVRPHLRLNGITSPENRQVAEVHLRRRGAW